MKKIFLGAVGAVAVAAVAVPLAFAGSANAAPVTGPYFTDFTGMSINNTPGADDGWRMTGPYDATIAGTADDPALRISNAVTSGSFGDQLFSPTLDVPATETGHDIFGEFHAGSHAAASTAPSSAFGAALMVASVLNSAFPISGTLPPTRR